jgi:dolichyl-diphosphooligosaccharide--protein glycosyltransferase
MGHLPVSKQILGTVTLEGGDLDRFLCAFSFTCEMAGESAGLLSAAFIGIVPGKLRIDSQSRCALLKPSIARTGYISRSVAGSYDNEAIAIFLLMFTFYLWIRALKEGSAFWGMIAAVFYGWMVAAWGGSRIGVYSAQMSF